MLPSEPPAHHRTPNRQHMLTILLVFAFTSEMKRENRKKKHGEEKKDGTKKGNATRKGGYEKRTNMMSWEGDRNQRRITPVVTQRTVSIITAIFSRRTPKRGSSMPRRATHFQRSCFTTQQAIRESTAPPKHARAAVHTGNHYT